jgi:hypothetical protein
VVQTDEPEWRSPVRVTVETALLPVDPSWFSEADEFQIVVIRDVFGGDHDDQLAGSAARFRWRKFRSRSRRRIDRGGLAQLEFAGG